LVTIAGGSIIGRSIMTLSPGTRLGAYEILRLLGRGGMGEVYRARDVRLGRDVAVKVMRGGDKERPDAIARLEHEARAVAVLSHPNIVAIYDVGTCNGTTFVVMELLEGESLRRVLSHGPLPARRALDYAIQIARGLAAAHEKGVVHRDLKPENIFVTAGKRVKILDFGLARRQADPNASTMEMATDGTTAPRTILGSVGYMAPEQIRGDRIDHRCDVFAFGTVVFEMLTGERAFARKSSVEAMLAVLDDEPPEIVTDSARHISPALVRTVRRCIDKDPAERFQCAKDLTFALENIELAAEPAAAITTAGHLSAWQRISAILPGVGLLVERYCR
jgi:serine/threonine protein kinase